MVDQLRLEQLPNIIGLLAASNDGMAGNWPAETPTAKNPNIMIAANNALFFVPRLSILDNNSRFDPDTLFNYAPSLCNPIQSGLQTMKDVQQLSLNILRQSYGLYL
jgi:hypothetical protein